MVIIIGRICLGTRWYKRIEDRKTAAKLKKSEFDFNDYLDAMAQMNKMGGLSSILSMMPGMGGKNMPEIDEKQLTRISSMIYSMAAKICKPWNAVSLS